MKTISAGLIYKATRCTVPLVTTVLLIDKVPKRSGFQCRLQWCNFGHPHVNRTPWTKNEDKKLIQLAKEPQNTWDVIAQKLQVYMYM